ncbi:DUF6864 domain-containing function [Rhizobium rhizogenes]|uniref:DUF6864 domain-containing function n=1 Tax=Rhizobium rhizogenes TaxID=359 RepID=UPI00157498B0|nr:hypothetical protein [Rhizobium rhizogenes]NTI74243.1 hypothetical protein [Rhizobium rhizogenes]
MANEPTLNFAQTPSVIVSLGDAEVLASATVVLPKGDTVRLVVADLEFFLKVESNGGEQAVNYEEQTTKGYTLVFHNFDNPLGTALRPVQIGTVRGKPLFFSVFVQAPAGATGPHVVSYCLYWGGNLG